MLSKLRPIVLAMLVLSIASASHECSILASPLQEQSKSLQSSSSDIAQALGQLNCHEDPMCFIRAARSLADREEQLDLALACVKHAGEIPPVANDAVPRASFFLTLAYVQIKRLEFDQAIATLKRGAQRAPEYARLDEYLNYLGLAYENSGRIDDAIETYVTLAGGLEEISREPSETLVALYRKRFGSLDGLKEKIEANRLAARRKFFIDNHLLRMPAPPWSLRDLDGKQVGLSDFSNKILVLAFVSAGGNVQDSLLKSLQAKYEKYKDQGIAFVLVDYVEHPDTQLIKNHLREIGVTIPTLIDYSLVARRYNTIEPLIVLIDDKGVIRFRNSLWHNYHPYVTEQIKYLLESRAAAPARILERRDEF